MKYIQGIITGASLMLCFFLMVGAKQLQFASNDQAKEILKLVKDIKKDVGNDYLLNTYSEFSANKTILGEIKLIKEEVFKEKNPTSTSFYGSTDSSNDYLISSIENNVSKLISDMISLQYTVSNIATDVSSISRRVGY